MSTDPQAAVEAARQQKLAVMRARSDALLYVLQRITKATETGEPSISAEETLALAQAVNLIANSQA